MPGRRGGKRGRKRVGERVAVTDRVRGRKGTRGWPILPLTHYAGPHVCVTPHPLSGAMLWACLRLCSCCPPPKPTPSPPPSPSCRTSRGREASTREPGRPFCRSPSSAAGRGGRPPRRHQGEEVEPESAAEQQGGGEMVPASAVGGWVAAVTAGCRPSRRLPLPRCQLACGELRRRLRHQVQPLLPSLPSLLLVLLPSSPNEPLWGRRPTGGDLPILLKLPSPPNALFRGRRRWRLQRRYPGRSRDHLPSWRCGLARAPTS